VVGIARPGPGRGSQVGMGEVARLGPFRRPGGVCHPLPIRGRTGSHVDGIRGCRRCGYGCRCSRCRCDRYERRRGGRRVVPRERHVECRGRHGRVLDRGIHRRLEAPSVRRGASLLRGCSQRDEQDNQEKDEQRDAGPSQHRIAHRESRSPTTESLDRDVSDDPRPPERSEGTAEIEPISPHTDMLRHPSDVLMIVRLRRPAQRIGGCKSEESHGDSHDERDRHDRQGREQRSDELTRRIQRRRLALEFEYVLSGDGEGDCCKRHSQPKQGKEPLPNAPEQQNDGRVEVTPDS